MANAEPFERLTGVLTVYIGPVGETVPAVNATPAGNWVELGATDGEQSVSHAGGLTKFYDNEHQAPVKAVRPQEDPVISFTLVGLTLEHYSRIISDTSQVTSAAGPPATKTLPLKRGFDLQEYAFLFKGATLSPYGAFPGMYVVPRCVVQSEPAATFVKDGSPGLAVELAILEDDDQSAGDELGWLVVQTA